MNDDCRAVVRRITPPIYSIVAAALMIALHVCVPARQLIADVIAAEERMIESAFGGAYLEYKSHVRRWL